LKKSLLILFVLPLLAFLSACGPGAPAQEVALEARDFEFNTPALEVEAGRPVVVTFVNRGQIDHALAFEEWGEATETLRPGESAELRFTPGETGSFAFYCAIPGHPAAGMTGTITVVDAG
jgi:uncharacterized cupredoxin-like copper-binding protein